MHKTNILLTVATALSLSCGLNAQLLQAAYAKASNPDRNDVFGHSISISGDTMVVGAFGESSNATGVNGMQGNNSASNAGAAYVFVRSAGVWTQQAYLKASNTDASDKFGSSVSISGDTVVIAADNERSKATGVNGDQSDNSWRGVGAAYVFVRSGTTWSQQAYLKASNTDMDDRFGCSVLISGDTVVVGAYGEDSKATGVNGGQANSSTATTSGAAYVFVRSGSTWSQQAYLKASNTDGGDSFGQSVSISGDTVVVGAWGEASRATGVNGNQGDNTYPKSGAAYVFVRSGTTWSQQAYLKASNTGLWDSFGQSISISGDTLVVGAWGETSRATGVNGNQGDNSAVRAGAAYAFVRSGGVWKQQAYLKASNTDADDRFGVSVSVSGDTVAVGAYGEDSKANGVNGDQGDNSAAAAGAAYAFVRSGGVWKQQAYLKASNTDADDRFGVSVSVSGDAVVVGAFGEASKATGVNGDQANNSADNAGAAYVFQIQRCIASSTSVGTGCIATGTAPSLAADLPVQGKSTQLRVGSSLPNAAGVVLLGIPHKGIPLSATCTAYFDITLPTLLVFFSTDALGTWLSPKIAISTDPSLTCSEIALQAALDNLPTAPFGMAMSNGVWVRIGN